MPTKSNKTYTYAIGRRKSAISKVKLFTGKTESIVNGKSVKDYFAAFAVLLNRPFEITGTQGKYYFDSKIVGGGKKGQLQALTLAISRALKKINPDFTKLLRSAKFLTVDSRVRERRMVGTGGKARRQKQSPKR